MSDYILDGKPVRWTALIEAARELSPEYAANGIKTTSEAAYILRENGHTVADAAAKGEANGG